MGYAAALGLLVLVVLLLVTLAQFALARFWVHDEIGGLNAHRSGQQACIWQKLVPENEAVSAPTRCCC